MQISYFTHGGFVIHKIPNGAGVASAWFDANGAVVDIEAFDKAGRIHAYSQALRSKVESLGRIHATQV